jgi:hypothetical protein
MRVGCPAGLSGFALFVGVTSFFLSLFMLMVPVAYDKWDKFVRLARALQEVRVSFILATAGLVWSLLIRYVSSCAVGLSSELTLLIQLYHDYLRYLSLAVALARVIFIHIF